MRRGRRIEFAAFEWQGEMPDPQDETTFLSAKLRHELRAERRRTKSLLEFYRELIGLRKKLPALERLAKESMEVVGCENEKVLVVHRWHGDRARVARRQSAAQTRPPSRFRSRGGAGAS